MKRDAKPAGALPATVRKLRCAVYTRKSREEGLDMKFHSLDAQRKAREAFVIRASMTQSSPRRSWTRRTPCCRSAHGCASIGHATPLRPCCVG